MTARDLLRRAPILLLLCLTSCLPGDPGTPVYVMNEDSVYAVGIRSCYSPVVSEVEIRIYGDNDVVWKAVKNLKGPSLSKIEIFASHINGYTITTVKPYDPKVRYDLTVNRSSGLAVKLDEVPNGLIFYGPDRALTPDEYFRLPDQEFGCP